LYRYNEGDVDPTVFGCLNDAGIVYDGGEVRINRSTYQVKPFYLSIETVLPVE
jgi:hypothetical protein